MKVLSPSQTAGLDVTGLGMGGSWDNAGQPSTLQRDAANLTDTGERDPGVPGHGPAYFTVSGSPVLTEFQQNIKCKMHFLCRTFLFCFFPFLPCFGEVKGLKN